MREIGRLYMVALVMAALLFCAQAAASLSIVSARAAEALPTGNEIMIGDDEVCCAIDAEHFPDPNFRAWVKENCDPYGFDMLTYNTIQNTTEMDLRDLGIKSLEGIRYFRCADVIDCSGNQLTEIDISNLPMLKTLDCSYNAIRSIRVAEKSDLETLACGGNALTALNLPNMPKLLSLGCSDNPLIKINLTNMPQVQSLYCGDNPLQSFIVPEGSALEYLDISYDRIDLNGVTLDLNNAQNLKEVRIGGCFPGPDNGSGIAALDVSRCSRLEKLYLGFSKLYRLVLGAHPLLTDVVCTYSFIDTLNVSQCPKLERLDCYHCQLNALDVRSNPNLKTLGLASNNLAALDVTNCARLEELGVSWNPISELNVSGCPRLKDLAVVYTQVRHLDISSCPELLSVLDDAYLVHEPGDDPSGYYHYDRYDPNFPDNKNGLSFDAAATVVAGSRVIEPKKPAATVALDRTAVTLYLTEPGFGSQMRLNCTVTPADAKVDWSVGDSSVVRVKDGLLTGLKAGATTVTATAPGGASVSCDVRVVRLTSTLTLPGKLKTIDTEAFAGLSTIQAVVIPSGTTRIGARAFANDTALRIIYIPASVATIDKTAFSGCAQLRIHCPAGSAAGKFASENGLEFFAGDFLPAVFG